MNAVGYLRLSTKDQSKSLEYQESIIRDYCKRNKLNVLDVFQDNGQSSYNFDRPDYLALEQFIKKHKGKCQYLIVLDHDRFSRNLPEALLKIEELERKYNVIVLSTNERVDLDTSDPDVFMKRAFDYLIANRELLTIRNRTRLGIRNARENGRYLGKAPFGYDNIKQKANLNTIRINNEKAFIIEKIFNDFLQGIPPYLIHQHVKTLGFKNTGNSAIKHVLSNCTYAGLIKVPVYKTQPEKYVKAMHEPIISEKKYWNVQKILKAKTSKKARIVADIPLRGILKCWCGKNLSAGWSKGRSKHYLYYNCTLHRSPNISGNIIHSKLEMLLKNIFLQPHQIELLMELTKSHSLKQLNQYNEDYAETKKAIKRIDKQISQISEKLINDQIDYPAYKKWTEKYKVDKRNLEANISLKTKDAIAIVNESETFLTGKINMFKIYATCTLSQSQYLLLSIFKNTLSWENNCLSATFFNPFLASNLTQILSKNLLIIKVSNHI